jgi:hypothetical protein
MDYYFSFLPLRIHLCFWGVRYTSISRRSLLRIGKLKIVSIRWKIAFSWSKAS